MCKHILGYSLKSRITGSKTITYIVYKNNGPTISKQWQKNSKIMLNNWKCIGKRIVESSINEKNIFTIMFGAQTTKG